MIASLDYGLTAATVSTVRPCRYRSRRMTGRRRFKHEAWNEELVFDYIK